MSLESQIDDLYRGPLSAFTTARNALVKSLRGADAAHVRALVKPTAVAAAVNHVHWHARATSDRLMKVGARLRDAQVAAINGRRVDVPAASDAHARALADAVKKAGRIADAEGAQPDVDELRRTLEALSLAGPGPAPPPGRLTRPLQPVGFEAFAGVTLRDTPRAPLRLVDPPKAREVQAPRTSNAGNAASARVAAKRAAGEAKRAAADAKRASEDARRRDAARKRAEADVLRAEEGEAAARVEWQRAQRALLAARAVVAGLG